jgi:hypothetical protein
MSTDWIAVGHMIKIVYITHVPGVQIHDVRFHGTFAVVTKIFCCWWWVYVSQHVNFSSVCPNYCSQTSPSPQPYVTPFQFQLFGPKSQVMSFILGCTVLLEFILCLS